MSIRMVSWNLNGRTNPVAEDARRAWLSRFGPNTLIMPHPPVRRKRLEADLTDLGLRPDLGVWLGGPDGKHGLGLVADRPFGSLNTSLNDRTLHDVSLGRFAHVTVDNGRLLNILGVYIPLFRADGSLKRSYTDALLWYIETHRLHLQDTVVAGDFNLVRNPLTDMENPSSWPWEPWELEFMHSLGAMGFLDVCQPTVPPVFTWRSKYGYRLDYIFVSESLMADCTSSGIDTTAMGKISDGKGSDHAPIFAEFQCIPTA